MSRKNSYSLETEVVHYQTGDEYNASVPPLYQTATFKQQSLSNMGEYDYTRSGNPTRTQLQNHLAKIMRADHVYAVSSGMTCLDVITKMLKPGDEVIAGDDLYGGSDRLLTYLNNKGDIKVKHIDTTKTSDVISAITEKTAMIFLSLQPIHYLKLLMSEPLLNKHISSTQMLLSCLTILCCHLF